MRRAICLFALSLIAAWGDSFSAEARWCHPYVCVGIPYSSPCSCIGFYAVDSRLGLGPGYPGFFPFVGAPLPCSDRADGSCASCWAPPVTSIVVVPVPYRLPECEVALPEPRIAQDEEADRGQPASTVEGAQRGQPLPGVSDIPRPPGWRIYTPSRCFGGKCYPVSNADALGPSPASGIIIWTPEN